MAATVDEAKQKAADQDEVVKRYKGIMGASTHIGVPLCLALGTFFTTLTMRAGIGVAIVAFVAVYFLSWWVVKTFFSSH